MSEDDVTDSIAAPWKATQGMKGANPAPGQLPAPEGPHVAPRPPRVADTSWRDGVPPVLGEHRGSFADAEREVSYRWIAPAAANRTALDIGCEAGHGTAVLERAGAQNALGVDADPPALEAATRLYGERVRFLEAEAMALPLADDSFSLVCCFGPLERSPDPAAILDQIRRVLSADGLLAVSLPLSTPRDAISGEPLTATPTEESWRELLESRFANVSFQRRRACFGAAVVPERPPASSNGDAISEVPEVRWLGADESEDRGLLALASDGELPELEPTASLIGSRDLAAYRETIAAWEQRARKAEADGAAKHWELVASREAQRRLRKRLYELEHKPLRKLFRVLRGRPARLGEGPPIRPPERPPEAWD